MSAVLLTFFSKLVKSARSFDALQSDGPMFRIGVAGNLLLFIDPATSRIVRRWPRRVVSFERGPAEKSFVASSEQEKFTFTATDAEAFKVLLSFVVFGLLCPTFF